MSWIQKLFETYNNCQSSIGYSEKDGVRPLLPICHITTQAHVEVIINSEGSFQRANIIYDKNNRTTIIPSTEGSASRSGSKPECHPLCDKLQYVAGDFVNYGGLVTSGFSKNPKEPYNNYIELLSQWCQSKFAHPKSIAVLKYAKRGTLIGDLAAHKIFIVENNKIVDKNEIKREKNATDIFSVIDSQSDTFIRWIVEEPDITETKVWKDKSLWDSWINYYLDSKKKESLCFVTGEEAILTTNHPKYIRREGDGAKIISANDTSGFTFRGRFVTDQQASSLSLEVSQKAHYALAWLISRQGYQRDDLAIVAWATTGADVPKFLETPLSIIDIENLESDSYPTPQTAQIVAEKFKKRIAGYGKEIGDTTDIVVIGLDSATPGRLAITYYRELKGSEFLKRIDDWHKTSAWIHYYNSINTEEKKSGKKIIPFIGAPAPIDIAEAAYATNRDGKFEVDKKLRKATIERLLPCIIDGQQIPRDIVESAVRKASNRIALEDWQWNKVLTIACSLFKKYNRKENYDMALDPNRKTRDYLYGRLLALADSLEEWALNEAKEERETNAARLMQRFSEHPYTTWKTIELALRPYIARLGGKSKKRQRMISEVITSFNENDFLNDKKLSGEFLLGYHSQREFLRNSRSSDADVEINETTNN